jgi:hypothetical protein
VSVRINTQQAREVATGSAGKLINLGEPSGSA